MAPAPSGPAPEAPGFRGRRGESGFTLVEMPAVVAIIAIVGGMGLPKLESVVRQAKIARAIAEIGAIQWDLMALESTARAVSACGPRWRQRRI